MRKLQQKNVGSIYQSGKNGSLLHFQGFLFSCISHYTFEVNVRKFRKLKNYSLREKSACYKNALFSVLQEKIISKKTVFPG